MEEISSGCASTGVIMSVNNSLYCDPVLKFGTEEQKRRWLAPFASSEKLGVLEPGTILDVVQLRGQQACIRLGARAEDTGWARLATKAGAVLLEPVGRSAGRGDAALKILRG